MRSTANITQKFREARAEINSINNKTLQLEQQRDDNKKSFEEKDRLLQQQISALKSQIKPVFGSDNIFRAACLEGDMELVNDYYQWGLPDGTISYDQNDQSDGTHGDPINNAIKGDHPEILRLLLKHVVDQVHSAVYAHLKEENEDEKKIETVRKHVIDVIGRDKIDFIPYYYNLRYGFDKVYIEFLANRSQPLLIEAILLGSTKCATLLLNEFGADPRRTPYYDHVRNGCDWRPTGFYTVKGEALGLAIDRGLTDVALLLIQKGANVNAYYGNQQKDIEESSSLAGYSRYYTRKGFDGKMDLSPLMLAAMRGNVVVVKELLAKGADYHRHDRNGKTAMQFTDNTEILKLFEQSINADAEKLREEIHEHNVVVQVTKNPGILKQSQSALCTLTRKLNELNEFIAVCTKAPEVKAVSPSC